MRLTDKQVEQIKQSFNLYFLPQDHLWLFGSRVDMEKQGGDIDLYIETHYDSLPEIVDKKIYFLVKLKSLIGEQRIDVVINRLSSGKMLPIYQEAKNTGILLV